MQSAVGFNIETSVANGGWFYVQGSYQKNYGSEKNRIQSSAHNSFQPSASPKHYVTVRFVSERSFLSIMFFLS